MVECVVEVPCLHYADGLRRTYGGKTMIVTVLALYSVRCASYALLDAVPGHPALVLLVEPLHGVTFAFFYTAGVSTARELLPKDWQTLAQGLFSAAFTGGSGLGAALGGFAVHRVGFHKTFLAFAALFAVAAVSFSTTLDDGDDADAADADARRAAAADDDVDDDDVDDDDDDDDGGFDLARGHLNLNFREVAYDDPRAFGDVDYA